MDKFKRVMNLLRRANSDTVRVAIDQNKHDDGDELFSEIMSYLDSHGDGNEVYSEPPPIYEHPIWGNNMGSVMGVSTSMVDYGNYLISSGSFRTPYQGYCVVSAPEVAQLKPDIWECRYCGRLNPDNLFECLGCAHGRTK